MASSKGKGWRILLLILLVIIVELLFSWPKILNSLGNYLIFEEEPQRGDVIVVLGCWEDTVVRAWHAADLYREGLAPVVFLPGVAKVKRWMEAEGEGISMPDQRSMLKEALRAFGVPKEAIRTVDEEVGCTEDEAEVTRKWLKGKNVRRVLLVTSRYHSRRAWILFRDALQGMAEVVSLPSPYDDFQPDGWWRRREDAKRVVLEYEKLLYYKLRR